MIDFDLRRTTARADLCRLLSACYYQPSPEYVEEKVFDSMLDAAPAAHADLVASVRRLGAAFAADDLQTLLVDYTRLFLGPVRALAPPYESVWLGDRAAPMQESTPALLALYAAGGFEIDDGFRDLPDHVAAELEFLYLLIFSEAEACHAGDAAARDAAAKLRQRLLDEHLARWIGPFAAAMGRGAQTGFYRALADLTDRFVRLEAHAGG